MKIPFHDNPCLKEKVAAGLVLAALVVIYYNSVAFRGYTFMTTMPRSYQMGLYHDAGIYSLRTPDFPTKDPAAANQINLSSAYLEHHYLKKFQLPLWNPYSGLGRPYHADMNSYTFFLPLYPFKLFPSVLMYDLFLLFRLFAAGFFLFLLLRLYKCPFWGAAAGASFYMFNSYFHAYIDMDQLNVTMLLSAMAYFLTKSLFSMDKRYLLGFGLASAGAFYGGNPNEFILVHVFLFVYFLFLLYAKRKLALRKRFSFLLAYGGAFVLSALLCSVKLLPFMEFWKNSYSSRAGGLTGTTVFLPFKKFLAWILFPNQMFGGPNYAGYLILTLLFYALFNLIRKRWGIREKLLAFHLVLLFLWISKISGASYINWVGTLPLLKDVHFVKYCSLIYYLISVTAGLSLTYLLEEVKKTRIRIIRLLLFLFCFFLPHFILWLAFRDSLLGKAQDSGALVWMFVFFILTGSFLILVKKAHLNKILLHAGIAVLMVLAVCELRVNNAQPYRKRFKIDDRAPYTRFLLEQEQPYRALGINHTLAPDHNLVYPIPTINRMYAIRLTRPTVFLFKLVSVKFDSGMPHAYHKEEVLNNPFLDMLNTKYYVTESALDSLRIDPDYARSHRIEDLINNPSMQYTHYGDLYYYPHRGWQQMADSSVDIPLQLPGGEVYLKATALAFHFEKKERENYHDRLHLAVSVKTNEKRDVVYQEAFIPGREGQDYFDLKVDLSSYAGREVILNFRLKNPGARDIRDRTFFFGDLRIVSDHKPGSGPPEPVPYEEVFSHHALVYKNKRALRRGFMLYRIREVRDLDEAAAIMAHNPLIFKHTALIEGDPPQNVRMGKIGRSKVNFIQYQANRIEIEVESTENGVFVLSDSYYPGWKAYVDKKKVDIYPAFGALRAVFLPAGRHQVEFLYRPWTFYLGAGLTFLGLLLIPFLFFKMKP